MINYRASYAEETAAMVDALVNQGIAPAEIGFFTQRDGYGDAGFDGGIEALRHFGLLDATQVAHGRYNRNTTAIEGGLADLMLHDPQPKAVIMVGAYLPCAKFIHLSREVDFKPEFLNVSFVGTESLVDALGAESEGVVITQVVPHYDADLPVVHAYRRALRNFDSSLRPTFGSLEGYIATTILIRSLKSIDGEITREAIVNALERMGEFDAGLGTNLKLSSMEHQACHRIWPTVVRGRKAVALDWDSKRQTTDGGLQ